MKDAFGKLSTALQYQIVNGLGFRELRPVQELSIGAICAGKNCVVLAPTAGGKTEAAFFPLLSLMDSEDWRPVSVIYVAPIRALLNNQEARIERYAGLIGRRAFKWHGDVAASKKRGFCEDPADVLLTTPESLEVMLMSRKVPAARLFRHLRAVVIDEVHAFAGDDRGGHLSAVLERLSRFCGRDVQRIGLSATVGNPEAILAWAAGSSAREGEVVDPGGAANPAELSLDWVGSLDNAARVIAALHPGKKRLVFADSRRSVESLGQRLRELGVDSFVTHSSLSADERRLAEEAFASRPGCVIVATSALELGIDIGDLDHVIQIDAPDTVASFLQRMGRTGRRPGTTTNCTFLVTKEDMLPHAAGLLELYGRGFVEPIFVQDRAAHLLAHQIMALCIQQDGVPVSDWWAWVKTATPFRGLDEADRRELLAHMMDEGILFESGGRLALGPLGERLYGWRNFAELYAVFQAPKTLTVLWGPREVGTIDATFAEQQELSKLSFILAARAWRAIDINFSEGIIRVEPIERGDLARWQGRAKLLGQKLCEAMRAVLTGTEDHPSWSRRARAKLGELRAEYEFLPADGLELRADGHGYRLWTFAGGRANNVLGRVLEAKLGERVTIHNLYIGFREDAAKSSAAIGRAIDELRQEGRPNHADALRFASMCARGRISKFQPCLSHRLEAEYLAATVVDESGARAVLNQPLVTHSP